MRYILYEYTYTRRNATQTRTLLVHLLTLNAIEWSDRELNVIMHNSATERPDTKLTWFPQGSQCCLYILISNSDLAYGLLLYIHHRLMVRVVYLNCSPLSH